MAYSKEREAIWHVNVSDGENYFTSLAKLSLIKKGIYSPTALQIQLEKLFLSHEFLKKKNFLGELSTQELICLLLTAWGIEVKKIAEILKIKEDSVHKFRARITQKLNAKNVPNAVHKANLAGLLTFDNIDFLLQFINKRTSQQPSNQTNNTLSKEFSHFLVAEEESYAN